MNAFNFGRDQLQKGMLNNMLEQVGIDDVGSFVNQFRQTANQEASSQHQRRDNSDEEGDEDSSVRQASNQQSSFMSTGRSFLNQVRESNVGYVAKHASSFATDQFGGGGGGEGGNNSGDMIQGAMKAYKMFSGGQGHGGSSGGGGFLDNISRRTA